MYPFWQLVFSPIEKHSRPLYSALVRREQGPLPAEIKRMKKEGYDDDFCNWNFEKIWR